MFTLPANQADELLDREAESLKSALAHDLAETAENVMAAKTLGELTDALNALEAVYEAAAWAAFDNMNGARQP